MAQTQVFKGTARKEALASPGREYRYHDTAVVTVSHCGQCIWLDSGGWRTATTLRAMNQASSQQSLGFKVYQRKGDWFVDYKGETLQFVDHMLLK